MDVVRRARKPVVFGDEEVEESDEKSMLDENGKELLRICRNLVNLLENPDPGGWTWHQSVIACRAEFQKFNDHLKGETDEGETGEI